MILVFCSTNFSSVAVLLTKDVCAGTNCMYTARDAKRNTFFTGDGFRVVTTKWLFSYAVSLFYFSTLTEEKTRRTNAFIHCLFRRCCPTHSHHILQDQVLAC